MFDFIACQYDRQPLRLLGALYTFDPGQNAKRIAIEK
jgi:hypothetical protein